MSRDNPQAVENRDFNGGNDYATASIRTMVSDKEMDKLVEGVLYAQATAEAAGKKGVESLVAGDNISIVEQDDGTVVISSTANNAFIDLAKCKEGNFVSMSKLNEAIRQAYNAKDPACARVNIYISSDEPLSVDIAAIQFVSNCNYYFNAASDSVLYTINDTTINAGGVAVNNLSNCDFHGIDIETCRIVFYKCKNLQFFNCEFGGNTLAGSVTFDQCSDIYMDNCQFVSSRTPIQINSVTDSGFEWIMFENCIFLMSNAIKALTAASAVNPNEIITFANCYYSDMTLVTKEYVDYNPRGARINVALYEITSLTAEEVSDIFENA